jgi:RNA polymerase sigma-70 factor (ECF subfamily)
MSDHTGTQAARLLRASSTDARDEVDTLLRGCLRGEVRAWGRLLSEIRALALEQGRWRYRLNREDTEDMAQVVQIRVAERLPQLRDRAAFSGWLRRLIHCAAIDALRARRPSLSLEELFAPGTPHPYEPEAEDETGRILLRTDLDEALERLPDRYREPIRLHLLDGLPQDEVGRVLGRPRSTVASQIERGLRRLERSLHTGYASMC